MSRRQRGPAELQAQFEEQWGFLRKSCDAYDRGDENEAKRLAVTLRLLLHDTKSSHSLLGQLGLKDILFFDTSEDINRDNLLPTFGLVLAQVGPAGVRYIPPLADLPPRAIWMIPFEYWWKKPVICLPGAFELSRADLILVMANQDGGAHVDPAIDDNYYRLTRENALGMVAVVDGIKYQVPHIATASVRQIAQEILVSLAKPHRMIPPDLGDEPLPSIHTTTKDASTGETRTELITPINMCMCNSGLEYKDCHAHGGKNEGKIVPPRTI